MANMEFINIEKLNQNLQQTRDSFQNQKPFHYTMFEGFFYPEKAEVIYENYPTIQNGTWNGRTYVDQKNKFHTTKFESDSVFERAFKELNSPEFLKWLETVTGIEDLLGDNDLEG